MTTRDICDIEIIIYRDYSAMPAGEGVSPVTTQDRQSSADNVIRTFDLSYLLPAPCRSFPFFPSGTGESCGRG
jgi:hypothetical protein